MTISEYIIHIHIALNYIIIICYYRISLHFRIAHAKRRTVLSDYSWVSFLFWSKA